MTALVRRVGSVVDAVDMFSGFGGTSGGIKAAGATVRVAADHNPHAIDVHAANFPDTGHHVADLVDVESPTYIDRSSAGHPRHQGEPSMATQSPTWLITDHSYRPAMLGDTWFDPERADLDQPCGLGGEDWCWHAGDTDYEAAA